MSPNDIVAEGGTWFLSLMQIQGLGHYPVESIQTLAWNDRITLAGLPATTAPGGTSLVTTLPAPIIAFSPIVIPQSSVVPEPIEAPRFIRVRMQAQSASVCSRPLPLVARG